MSGWLRHCIQYIKFYLGTPAPKTSNHISTNAFQYCTFSYSILHTFPSILEKCAILHAKIGRTKIDKTSIFLYISFQLKILIFLYDFDSTTQGPRKIDNCGARAHIRISCSQTIKQSISKEINDAQHENMNMCPHPYRSSEAPGTTVTDVTYVGIISLFLSQNFHMTCSKITREYM